MKDRVEWLRQERGIGSLENLLERIQRYQPSLAWSTLSQIINGHRSPRLENVVAIAQALETTVAYLIGETLNPAPHLCAVLPSRRLAIDGDSAAPRSRRSGRPAPIPRSR